MLQTQSAQWITHLLILYGLDQCKGDYVLQTDSDCIFFRKSRDHDYISEMTNILEIDQTAVTVTLPIPYEKTQPYIKHDENGKPFRVEVRCCLLNIKKLKSMLPLWNETQNNQLKLAWHHSLDRAKQRKNSLLPRRKPPNMLCPYP